MKFITITIEELKEILHEELSKVVSLTSTGYKEKVYLNVSQLSQYIFLSVPAIYQRVANDTIPHSRIGTRIIFEKSEIDAWIKTSPKNE